MWSGAELAERLEVSGRTVRKDIERLRQLDYPVEAVRGPGGYYRLDCEAAALLLDDEEAVAVAVGLRAITGVRASRRPAFAPWSSWRPCSPSASAAGQRRTGAVQAGPENTGTNAPDPVVDAGLLMSIAAAIRDHQEVRLCIATMSGSKSSRTGWSAGSDAGISWPAMPRIRPGPASGSTGCSYDPLAAAGSHLSAAWR